MRRLFGNTGSSLRVTDHEIELLLQGQPTGSEELAALEPLVATLIEFSDVDPPKDPEHMATALAALARTGGRPARRRSRRFVAVAATVGLFFAMSGLAFAADGTAPGDFLYPVDRAFERIGILDGGIDERLDEFEALIGRGEIERAFEFLEEVIAEADTADAAKARERMQEAAAANEGAAAAQEKTDALHDFVDENGAPGVGVDGRDFGQGIADIASGNDRSEPGPPDHAGPKDDREPGPPDHANPGGQGQGQGNEGNQGQGQGNEGNQGQGQGNQGNQGQGQGNEGNQGQGQGQGNEGNQGQGQGNQGQGNEGNQGQGQGNEGNQGQGQGQGNEGNQGQGQGNEGNQGQGQGQGGGQGQGQGQDDSDE